MQLSLLMEPECVVLIAGVAEAQIRAYAPRAVSIWDLEYEARLMVEVPADHTVPI